MLIEDYRFDKINKKKIYLVEFITTYRATSSHFQSMYTLGPSINYVVSRGEGEGDQKLPILLSKKTTKRGSKITDFETT